MRYIDIPTNQPSQLELLSLDVQMMFSIVQSLVCGLFGGSLKYSVKVSLKMFGSNPLLTTGQRAYLVCTCYYTPICMLRSADQLYLLDCLTKPGLDRTYHAHHFIFSFAF